MQDADAEGEMGVISEFGMINGYNSNMVFKFQVWLAQTLAKV